MKDFKSYTPKDGDNKKTDNQNLNQTLELAKNIAMSMNGKSEGQILNAIIAEAEKSKREGKLTNADLDNFYATLAPMVDGAKRKKLKDIVERLKKI
jgi:hypothetical protein